MDEVSFWKREWNLEIRAFGGFLKGFGLRKGKKGCAGDFGRVWGEWQGEGREGEGREGKDQWNGMEWDLGYIC